jgi:hypothetical protein
MVGQRIYRVDERHQSASAFHGHYQPHLPPDLWFMIFVLPNHAMLRGIWPGSMESLASAITTVGWKANGSSSSFRRGTRITQLVDLSNETASVAGDCKMNTADQISVSHNRGYS